MHYLQLQSFFCVCVSILRQKEYFGKTLIVYFTIFPQFNYACDMYVRLMILFCYILVVLTRHLFENSNVFYFFKVPTVSNFLLIKKKNYSSLQDKVLSRRTTNFIDLQQLKCYTLRSTCFNFNGLKLKDLIFAVNINYKT